jgi:hypothetical protein
MPAHTPINLLKAGGGDFFSVQCQKLLIACGLHPDSFGSYSHCMNQKRAAEDKVNRWNAMTPAEQAANPGAAPTARDRFVAKTTPGHLTQDGVNRDARGPDGSNGRNNPCASLNRSTGYQHNNAPCANLPPATEAAMKNDETNQRRTQLANANPGCDPVRDKTFANDTYPNPQRTNDETARTPNVTNNQRQQWNDSMTAAGQPGSVLPPGTGPGGRADINNPAEMKAHADAIGAKVKEPKAIDGGAVDGQTAEECIDNFRERAKQEMAKSGTETAIKDAKQAKKEEIARRMEVRAATKGEAKATKERDAANARLEEARKNGASQATQDALQADLARKNAAADLAITRKMRAEDAHQASVNADRDIACLEQARARLDSNKGSDRGRAFP